MVSIVVPVYNCINSLNRCIKAIQSQIYLKWELILVDDGSRDGSGDICDLAAAEDPRIRVIHQLNSGVSSARNVGIDAAKGEFLLFCDSDDYPEPDWCLQLVNIAKKSPDTVPICNYYKELPNGSYINHENECCGGIRKIEKKDFFQLYMIELLGIPWNKLFRLDVIRQYNLRFRCDLSLGEDLLFNLNYMGLVHGGFTIINLPLYHYVLGNAESLSSKYYPNLVSIYDELYMKLKDGLDKYPESYNKYYAPYWTSYFFAYDRVFRNNFSRKCKLTKMQKWKLNSSIFHSTQFQNCRKAIPTNIIHSLQYKSLRLNSFAVYWIVVYLTELISKVKHSIT